MAKRWGSKLQRVFVAHQWIGHREEMKAREQRLRRNDRAIQASRTLPKEPSIINRRKYEIVIDHRAGKSLHYTALQLVILSKANNLRFFLSTGGHASNQRCLKAWPHASHFVAARRST
jgi:hypothetical protein